MPITTRDLCERALLALNILAAGEVMSADDGVYVLSEFNDLLDEWNSERAAVYGDVYTAWTLSANLAPHTIGPTGTLVVPQRPQTIDFASVQVASGSWDPIDLIDRVAWQAIPMPTLTSPRPTGLYYNPLWPNGVLNFFPVPSAAAGIELVTRQVLGPLILTDTFSLPPGYRSALTKTLAERIAASYEKAIPVQLARDAALARARIWTANTVIPTLVVWDAGMPGRRRGTGYNYRSGGGGGTSSRWSE